MDSGASGHSASSAEDERAGPVNAESQGAAGCAAAPQASAPATSSSAAFGEGAAAELQALSEPQPFTEPEVQPELDVPPVESVDAALPESPATDGRACRMQPSSSALDQSAAVELAAAAAETSAATAKPPASDAAESGLPSATAADAADFEAAEPTASSTSSAEFVGVQAATAELAASSVAMPAAAAANVATTAELSASLAAAAESSASSAAATEPPALEATAAEPTASATNAAEFACMEAATAELAAYSVSEVVGNAAAAAEPVAMVANAVSAASKADAAAPAAEMASLTTEPVFVVATGAEPAAALAATAEPAASLSDLADRAASKPEGVEHPTVDLLSAAGAHTCQPAEDMAEPNWVSVGGSPPGTQNVPMGAQTLCTSLPQPGGTPIPCRHGDQTTPCVTPERPMRHSEPTTPLVDEPSNDVSHANTARSSAHPTPRSADTTDVFGHSSASSGFPSAQPAELMSIADNPFLTSLETSAAIEPAAAPAVLAASIAPPPAASLVPPPAAITTPRHRRSASTPVTNSGPFMSLARQQCTVAAPAITQPGDATAAGGSGSWEASFLSRLHPRTASTTDVTTPTPGNAVLTEAELQASPGGDEARPMLNIASSRHRRKPSFERQKLSVLLRGDSSKATSGSLLSDQLSDAADSDAVDLHASELSAPARMRRNGFLTFENRPDRIPENAEPPLSVSRSVGNMRSSSVVSSPCDMPDYFCNASSEWCEPSDASGSPTPGGGVSDLSSPHDASHYFREVSPKSRNSEGAHHASSDHGGSPDLVRVQSAEESLSAKLRQSVYTDEADMPSADLDGTEGAPGSLSPNKSLGSMAAIAESAQSAEDLHASPPEKEAVDAQRRVGMPVVVASAEQEILLAVHKFNQKPKAGIAYLFSRSVLPETAEAVAHFLRTTKGLSKRRIGDYLGERSDFTVRVLTEYVRLFDFAAMSFVEAVRAFLSPFRLPGEAQKIDRIMQSFSGHFCEQSPDVFRHPDTAYVLGFSVIMLNTDAHSSQIKQKMTKAEFVRNNRGIDQGSDLPEEFLTQVYDDITTHEIQTGMDSDSISMGELVEWLRQGSVFKKYAHSRIHSKRCHSCRLWLADNQLRYLNLSGRHKPEKAVQLSAIEQVLEGPLSDVFLRNGLTPNSAEASTCFSLVFEGRTLDLQASTQEAVSIWTHYFRQVVERSQLETHARQVALRGQPRESFLENASQIWCNEILPQWEEKHSLPRTQMLWWEGVPSALRPQLWPLAIGDALQHGEGGYAKWVAAAEPADREAARCLLEEEILQAADLPPELNIFTAPESPLRQSLLLLLCAVHAFCSHGNGPAPSERCSLLAAMLLLYLEPARAFCCICALLDAHFFKHFASVKGGAETPQRSWRLSCATQVFERELPELLRHLRAHTIELEHFIPRWLTALFMSTLSLDTAARLWDCYLRDGEVFAWRAALEMLRLLAPALLESEHREHCLELLGQPGSVGGVCERELFKSLGSHDVALHELLVGFSQRLPMPTIERGVCFDLWQNSYENAEPAQEEGEAPTREQTSLIDSKRASEAPGGGGSDVEPDFAERSESPETVPCFGPFGAMSREGKKWITQQARGSSTTATSKK